MDQEVSLDLLRSTECKLNVGAVHRIASLKSNHAAPAHAGKFGPHFGRGQTLVAKIVVGGNLSPFESSSDVPGIRLVDGVIGARMGGTGAGENGLSFSFPIGLP